MELPRKVYAIQHNITKRIYIGSSKNVEQRYKSHIWQLRAGSHHVEDMQADYDECGEDYSLFILDEIVRYEDRGIEYEWMKKFNTIVRGIGYNYGDKRRVVPELFSIPLKDGLPECLAVVEHG